MILKIELTDRLHRNFGIDLHVRLSIALAMDNVHATEAVKRFTGMKH